MKHLETSLTEAQFLECLETVCQPKERWDRSYKRQDTVVVKRRKRRFWLGKHYAHAGKTDGYATDCLHCRYCVDEAGTVRIKYRFGKLPMAFFSFLIFFVIGISLWIPLVYTAIVYPDAYWVGLIFSFLLWAYGLAGFLLRSREEQHNLEAHLYRMVGVTPPQYPKPTKKEAQPESTE